MILLELYTTAIYVKQQWSETKTELKAEQNKIVKLQPYDSSLYIVKVPFSMRNHEVS